MALLKVQGDIPALISNEKGLYEGDLKHYFRTLIYCADNVNHHYHNFRHICHVLMLCHDACGFYSEVLSPREMRNLLIGAIFHDFNHTGWNGPDSFNISSAKRALGTYIHSTDYKAIAAIEQHIEATEWPYSVLTTNLPLTEQIIREADSAQCLTTAWIQQVVFGLGREWGKTPLEMLELQLNFLGDLNYVTDWGVASFPTELIESKKEEVRALIELLA